MIASPIWSCNVDISLCIRTLKSIGLRTPPCGVPCSNILVMLLFTPLCNTVAVLLDRYMLIQVSSLPWISKSASCSRIMSLLAMSNADFKSMNTVYVSFFALTMYSAKQCCVLRPVMKPYSLGESLFRILYMRRSRIILSITLQRHEVRDIGLYFSLSFLGIGIIRLCVHGLGRTPS